MSNRADYLDWKSNQVTQEFLEYAADEQQGVRERSNIRDTVDQTAIQTAYSEGYCDGFDALVTFMEQKAMEEESTNES